MGQTQTRKSSGKIPGESLTHFQDHIIDRRSVLCLKKCLVDIEGFCIDEVAQGGRSATCGVPIYGLYDSGIALGANPYIIKRSNSGVEPETKPDWAQELSFFLYHRGPLLPCEEDIRHLPFLEVAAAPEAGMICFLDDGNEVVDIHIAVEKLAHMGVVGLPVLEKIGAKSPTACRVYWHIVEKHVLVIRTVAQRAWRRIRITWMRKNLIVKRPVISHNDHWLQASGTTRSWAVLMAALGIQFWTKFRRIRLDGDLFFDVVRVKRCFHGSNPFLKYPDLELQRYKRPQSPAILRQGYTCSPA